MIVIQYVNWIKKKNVISLVDTKENIWQNSQPSCDENSHQTQNKRKISQSVKGHLPAAHS